MKKLSFIALIFSVIFILSSCSEKNADGGTTSEKSSSETTASETASSDTTSVKATESQTTSKTEQRQLAPSFTVTDKDGKGYTIFDFEGKPMVINFWKSDCSPCKTEMPYFQKMYEKYGDDVNFAVINATKLSGETLQKATNLIASGKYTFPVYFDNQGLSVRAYFTGATVTLPTTIFITSDGYVQNKIIGGITSAKLESNIKSLIGD